MRRISLLFPIIAGIALLAWFLPGILVPKPSVEIINASYELGLLVVTLDASIETSNARIEVLDEQKNLLCTHYVDLAKGKNELKLEGCEIRERIVISVSPPEGVMKVKEFLLELPLLEFKQGVRYVYSWAVPQVGEAMEEIFLLSENGELKGILGMRSEMDSKKALLFRFKLDKENLTMLSSYPLDKEQILTENVTYITLKELNELSGEWGISYIPFTIVFLNELGELDLDELFGERSTVWRSVYDTADLTLSGPLTHRNFLAYKVTYSSTGTQFEFFISVAKPHLLIEMSGPSNVTLEGIDTETFDLKDYESYRIEVGYERLVPPKQHFEVIDVGCIDNTTAYVVILNMGTEEIRLEDIEVLRLRGVGEVNISWDKEVIAPDEWAQMKDTGCAVIGDEIEGPDAPPCEYQLTLGGIVKYLTPHCLG
jgi:hypothetical protein